MQTQRMRDAEEDALACCCCCCFEKKVRLVNGKAKASLGYKVIHQTHRCKYSLSLSPFLSSLPLSPLVFLLINSCNRTSPKWLFRLQVNFFSFFFCPILYSLPTGMKIWSPVLQFAFKDWDFVEFIYFFIGLKVQLDTVAFQKDGVSCGAKVRRQRHGRCNHWQK